MAAQAATNKSNSLTRAAGIYNCSTYENEKRDALDALGNYVMVAVAKADGRNVERLRRA